MYLKRSNVTDHDYQILKSTCTFCLIDERRYYLLVLHKTEIFFEIYLRLHSLLRIMTFGERIDCIMKYLAFSKGTTV